MSATVTCAWCDKSGHPDSHWTFDEDVALWFCCGECCSSHADEQDYDKLRARVEAAEARVKELEAHLVRMEMERNHYRSKSKSCAWCDGKVEFGGHDLSCPVRRCISLEDELAEARKLCGEAAAQLIPSMCPCGKCDSLQKRLRKFAEAK